MGLLADGWSLEGLESSPGKETTVKWALGNDHLEYVTMFSKPYVRTFGKVERRTNLNPDEKPRVSMRFKREDYFRRGIGTSQSE